MWTDRENYAAFIVWTLLGGHDIKFRSDSENSCGLTVNRGKIREGGQIDPPRASYDLVWSGWVVMEFGRGGPTFADSWTPRFGERHPIRVTRYTGD
jgi:hypothetical protein